MENDIQEFLDSIGKCRKPMSIGHIPIIPIGFEFKPLINIIWNIIETDLKEE